MGDEFVQFQPLLAANQISVVIGRGTVLSLNKFKPSVEVRDEFETDGRVVALPAQYGVMAYIGTEKATLFAYNMDNSKLAWRFFPGGAVRAQPAATDRDIFVVSDPVGLYRGQPHLTAGVAAYPVKSDGIDWRDW